MPHELKTHIQLGSQLNVQLSVFHDTIRMVQHAHFSMRAHITLVHQLSMEFQMNMRGSKVLVLEVR